MIAQNSNFILLYVLYIYFKVLDVFRVLKHLFCFILHNLESLLLFKMQKLKHDQKVVLNYQMYYKKINQKKLI